MGNGPNPSMHPIPITLVSEFRESAVQKLRFPLEELREVALSEDGMYAALVIRGQIFFTPLLEQLGSRIEQVTGFDGAVRYRHAQFVRSEHPEDPTKILAMSDASGEYEYVLLERLAGADTGVCGTRRSSPREAPSRASCPTRPSPPTQAAWCSTTRTAASPS